MDETHMEFESPCKFENGGASGDVGVVLDLVCGCMFTKCCGRDLMRE